MIWSAAKVVLKLFIIYIMSSGTWLINVSCQIGQKCEVARAQCAFRMGCGMALQSYIMDCADLISGHTTECSVTCQRALIALMSTEEGEMLIGCDCNGSEFCETNKKRIEVCRPEVIEATAVGSIVSCSTAQSICMADQLCATALDYYHINCRSMFQGRRCTARCKNSLDILNRQEKAAKLRSCYCEGDEDFACKKIKESTERLCFAPESNDPFNDHSNDLNLLISNSASSHHPSPFLFLLITAICSILLPLLFTRTGVLVAGSNL